MSSPVSSCPQVRASGNSPCAIASYHAMHLHDNGLILRKGMSRWGGETGL
jgi:hypothetical protein